MSDFSIDCEIQKFDDAENLVFGWASVSMVGDSLVIDSHGDTIELEDLEQAAYDFAVTARESGDMHKGEAFGEMVESIVVTPEKLARMGLEFSKGEEPKYGWWIGFRLPPGEFAKVRSGERPAFSIQGRAVREVVE